jgi:hypothetical protein
MFCLSEKKMLTNDREKMLIPQSLSVQAASLTRHSLYSTLAHWVSLGACIDLADWPVLAWWEGRRIDTCTVREDRLARVEALKIDKKLEEVRNNKILGPKYHFRDVKSEYDSGYYYYYYYYLFILTQKL